MNKGEFVKAMSAHGARTKKDAEHFLTIFADTLRDGLQRKVFIGNKVCSWVIKFGHGQ